MPGGGITVGPNANGLALTNNVLTLALASATSAGAMSAADYSMLADATDAATADTLVLRDANGGAAFGPLSVTGGETVDTLTAGDISLGVPNAVPVGRAACGTLTVTTTTAVAPSAAVAFTTVGTLVRATAAANNAGIVVTDGGVYEVTYNVNAGSPTTWQVTVNTAAIAGSVLPAGRDTPYSNTTTTVCNAGDTIALVNAGAASVNVTYANLSASCIGQQ